MARVGKAAAVGKEAKPSVLRQVNGKQRRDAIKPDEIVSIADLKVHPRNYKKHPEGQILHIAESLRQHGYYRNIIIARDGTILGGHGVIEAAKSIGWTLAPVKRMNLDPSDPKALKIVTGDNELGRFAESDDRALSELLLEIKNEEGLFGTGYDEEDLAALVMVTRPESELLDFDAAAEWVGMPEFVSGAGNQFILTVQCASAKGREEAAAKLGVKNPHKMKHGKIWTGWYPEKEQDDLSSLAWADKGGAVQKAKVAK